MHQDAHEAAARITKGLLKLCDLQGFKAAMRRFPDGDVIVSVKVAKPSRTLAQNSFWHGVVVPAFAEHCGYDPRDMKDVLALELLPREVTDFRTGEVRTVPGHTSELNTKQFNELIERAQQLGAEIGIVIPDPDPLWRQTRATTEAA